MDMSSKHDIGFGSYNERLEHHSHALTLHVVISVRVVPRRMHQNDEPRSHFPVDFLKLIFQPDILWCVLTCDNPKHISTPEKVTKGFSNTD